MSFARRRAPLAGVLAALLLALPAFAPWIDPRLDLFRVDDSRLHMVRLYHLGWLVERGVLYPRWVPDMFMGYGYPLLNFYGPAFYALGLTIQRLARADVWDTYRYAGLLIALWGTVGAYALTLGVWQRILPALFAALTVAYGPYVFQVNLWGRAALPEALALSLLPWLLLAGHRLWLADGPAAQLRWGAALALSGTVLWLSHNLTAVAAFAVVGLWLLTHLVTARAARAASAAHTPHATHPLRRVCAALALSLGLSSFFWLPALVEGRLVQLETFQTMSNLDWRGWLVEPSGLTDKDHHPDNRQTRYGLIDLNLHYPHQLIATPKISLAQAGLALLTGGVLAAALRRGPALTTALAAALMTVAIAGWFLTLSASRVLWERLPFLATFQHPWRLLGPAGIGLAVAGGGALSLLWDAAERRWGPRRGATIAGMMLALATAGFLFNSLGARRPPLAESPKRQIDARFVVADEIQDFVAAGTTGVREFLPRDVRVAEYTHGTPRHVGVFEWLYPDLDWLGGIFLPMGGDLRFLGWRAAPLRISARVANDSARPARLGVRQLRFAGWRAWLDGTRVDVGVPEYVPEQQMSPGFMVLEVPPGEHTLDLAFGPSAVRLAALAVTLASALTAAGAVLWLTRRAGGIAPWAWLLPLGSALLVLLLAYGCWRAARPMLGRFAALPVPPPQRLMPDGAWHAPDLAAPHGAGLVVNLAEAVRTGQAHVSSPTGPTLGLERFVDVRYLTVTDADALRGAAGTSRRQWLYLHPPSGVSVDVALPPRQQLWFQASLALDPATWTAPVGDGVRFTATVTAVTALPGAAQAPAAGAPTVILDRVLNPRASGEHRRFVPVAADLSPWAGRTVRLTLATDPRDDLSFDWAGLANPVIAALDTARDPLSRPTSR